jgi:methylthioribulose-1-phosphate dehydratase
MNVTNDLQIKLADTIRTYNKRGWSPATSTNYSFREDKDAEIIYVSRSGIDKAEFEPTDFITVDLEGKTTWGMDHAKPSAETLIHCEIYALFPETTVILHSHSKYSVLISEILKQHFPIEGYEIQKGFAGQQSHETKLLIPILENSQEMLDLTTAMKARKDELLNHCFIIQKHGTYAWGKNLFEAKRHLETLEYLLEVTYLKNCLATK